MEYYDLVFLKRMDEMVTNNSTIGSLTTGLNIIELISNADSPMKFTEIQEETNITKSNLYKYLNTLTQAGVVYRDPRQGDYALGYKLLKYSSKLIDQDEILQRLTYYLKEMSKETNMTTLIASWVNDRPIITQLANSNFGINIGATISTELPPLSSIGKVFAAYKDDESTELWKTSNLTADQLAILNEELPTIKQQKFAYSKEPLVRHVSSISFPILNYQNEIIAAVGIVGFTDDLSPNVDNVFLQKITPIVREMSSVFGYTE